MTLSPETAAPPPPAKSRQSRLSPAQMYQRFLASDASFNGRFFTGVLSTGIYCLPSCRARKPLRKNIRFFPTVEEARGAGLRPCRKCHPDDFARGADPVLESIETLVAEVRANPAAFPDARAMVKRSGFGATRLFELVRLHYHATPADLLLRARLEKVKRDLLATKATLASIALEAGFDSLSALHENFRRLNGLTPAAYRELRKGRSFEITLPDGYHMGYLRRALSRDPHSASERFENDVYTSAILLEGAPAMLELRLSPGRVEVSVEGRAGSLPAAHAMVAGILGLDQDAAAFARLAKRLGLARLVAGHEGMRISLAHSAFEGLLWAIIGQQINFPFACILKSRLAKFAGAPMPSGLHAPPTPAAIAALDPKELLPLQFSRQKSGYLVAAARLVAEGKLDLEALRAMSATRAERTLLALHGLGPWSVNYVMMRALGFADCVPLGDTGVTSGLQALLKLEVRPDVDATRRLMSVFSPHRSLATAHLWQFQKPIPA
ncbi:MAG TPA: Ada metal-binding domain-containing protein [Chthoniobacteraceae bacterium]|nr:Ada metal-binding domain-containing protein [Chthoniobacteraceae bacterium]